MKRQLLFLIIVIAITWFSSCKKDDGSTGPPPSSTIAEVEPNDNTPQALGTLGSTDLTVSGSAANASDIDLYSIALDGGGNLYARISWSGGSDLDLGVMNTNRVMINFQDTGNNPERCTLPSLSTGTYIIQVTSKTTTATSCTLTIGKR